MTPPPIDERAVIREVLDRHIGKGDAPKLEDRIAEALERSRRPLTRGEQVADSLLTKYPMEGQEARDQVIWAVQIGLAGEQIYSVECCGRLDRDGVFTGLHRLIAKLFDAERADAARAEREACIEVAMNMSKSQEADRDRTTPGVGMWFKVYDHAAGCARAIAGGIRRRSDSPA